MKQLTTITIAKDYLGFAAAPFTIFSATSRERLHGHGYRMSIRLVTEVGDDGLSFDYNVVKQAARRECDALDEYMLLPEQSPHLTIERAGDNYLVCHNGDQMQFLVKDSLVLPVRNITIEELSQFLLTRIMSDPAIAGAGLHELEVGVSSGSNQWGASIWRADEGS